MPLVRIFDTAIGERDAQMPAMIGGGVMQMVGISTVTASADPTSSNDSTQGYQVGSIWFNNTAGQLRWWECYSAAAGAAKWVFGGADYANGGTNPNTEVTQAGSSSAVMAAEGNINRQIPGVTGGIFPTTTGSDILIGLYTIPASFFDVAGRGLQITASGSLGANANTKRIKLWFNASGSVGGTIGGGTLVADTLQSTASGTAGGWMVSANVFKRGVAGANTQTCVSEGAIIGTTHSGVSPNTDTAAVESGAINVAVTANCGASINDAALNFLQVNGMN